MERIAPMRLGLHRRQGPSDASQRVEGNTLHPSTPPRMRPEVWWNALPQCVWGSVDDKGPAMPPSALRATRSTLRSRPPRMRPEVGGTHCPNAFATPSTTKAQRCPQRVEGNTLHPSVNATTHASRSLVERIAPMRLRLRRRQRPSDASQRVGGNTLHPQRNPTGVPRISRSRIARRADDASRRSATTAARNAAAAAIFAP
ncbi:MAG: hypothetical protein JWM88_981 [Verrucomicrobia bacterium]|nr:hypothetical protein [Verrucomicrobiota bacterium]